MTTKTGLTRAQRECVSLVKRCCREGASLEQIAFRLGVSLSSVSRWNRDVCVPENNTSHRLIPTAKELLRELLGSEE